MCEVENYQLLFEAPYFTALRCILDMSSDATFADHIALNDL